ncbi:MAG: LLM class flavin-dependent oxidoreductase [Deltaproteobacteria bacterium]|nr:LLM class flavin-dependent oxidoreductase [Deltaproteobacteria bacterium]
MAKISFGVALYGTEEAMRGVELAKLADALGYQSFWVGDSHMIWRELYVLLGAAGLATKRLRLGPGVTHPGVRHLTVTASAMVTLNEVTNGRALLGFGVGATGPENIGIKPVTVGQLEEAVRLLRKLTAGEEIRISDKSMRCVFASRPRIPIYIGTRSSKAMQMAARLADGIIYTGEEASVQPIVDAMRTFSAQAGRGGGEVKVVYRIPCSVADDPYEARYAVRGKIARTAMTHLGRLHKMGKLEDEEDRRAVERLWDFYDTYHHMGPEHSHLVREEWVDRFAVAGTPEQVQERIRNVIKLGVDEITIIPFGDSKEFVIKTFAKEVMEKL